MANLEPPDRRVTLLDAMIGLTEFAALMGLLAAATRDIVPAGGAASVAVLICLALIATLPLVGAWWLAVRFANESGRRRFGQRLAAHVLSVIAIAGLMVLSLLACGLVALVLFQAPR